MLRHKLAALVIASLLVGCASTNVQRVTSPEMIATPKIPAGEFKITDYGAVADGKTSNTKAIADAIAACEKAGGGTVIVPAGTFHTGPIRLVSKMNLRLDEGATLLFSNNFDDYPIGGFKPLPERHQSLISITGGHDVMISGKGKMDGQGKPWWDDYLPHKGEKDYIERRPKGIVFDNCQRVRVEGVYLTNFPMFHQSPTQCTDVTIESVTVVAPAKAPNTDSCNPSGWNIWVNNCNFDTGDDNIAVKPFVPGKGGRPSVENIWITNCVFKHGHGLSVGGQTHGGLRNMVVKNITFEDTECGPRLKAERGWGGPVENVTYENITLKNVKRAIEITSYYHGLPKPGQPHSTTTPATQRTPVWKNIRFKNITATGSTDAGLLMGLPEMPIEGVVMEDVNIQAKNPLRVGYTHGLELKNVNIRTDSPESWLIEEDVQGSGLPAKK
jgi:polygalacturonase